MKNIFKYFASAIVLAGLVFVSCSKEDLAPVTPDEEDGVKTYTLTITASKETAPDTKLLELGGVDNKTLYKKWTLNDEVSVYKGETLAGTLKATTLSRDGFDATLTGQLTGTSIAVGDDLVMKFRAPNYSSQDGTLAGISSTCDYAEAEVTVASVDGSGNITTATDALFKSKQAIVRFTIKNESGDPVPVTKLTIKAEGVTDKVDVNLATASNEVFVALAGISSKNLILEAKGEDGFDYSFRKASVTFDNSKYYGINVKMFCANTTPLTLVAKNAGTTVSFINKAPGPVYYKINNGDKETIAAGTTKNDISLPNVGDKVAFYGNNVCYANSTSSDYNSRIGCSNDCYIYGNIMSLINETDFSSITTLSSWTYNNFAFTHLFYNNTSIVNHSWKKLVLPATSLSEYCYDYMFEGCTGLTTAPDLPATTLAKYCYNNMFKDCTNLTKAPDILPAKTLVSVCYARMFYGCTSLTTAPDILAETASNSCCEEMFKGCTNLTKAPEKLLPKVVNSYSYYRMFENCTKLETPPAISSEMTTVNNYYGCAYMFAGCSSLKTVPNLPATTLGDDCYNSMFSGCTSLTTVPEDLLPATTLTSSCYFDMFENCTSLTNVPNLPAETLAERCYIDMFTGCKSLKTVPANLLPAMTMATACYYGMFRECTSLTNAPNLPATTLATECYSGMFEKCTSLITPPPTLPALELKNNCYQRMFAECTNLTSTPDIKGTTTALACCGGMFDSCTKLTDLIGTLPAITLAEECYYSMFSNCKSLKTIPSGYLPATNLAKSCYSAMFYGCEALETVPSNLLPATTLAERCYYYMFYSCRSFSTAPDLPAPTLVDYCYFHMFDLCWSLKYVKCLATDISATKCTTQWLKSTATPGASNVCTFVKAASMTSWPTDSVDGIPTGWTVSNAS